MSAIDDDTELHDLVLQTLEKKGILAKIRAQLRACVFLALEEQESVNFQTPADLASKEFRSYLYTKEGKLVTSLVREFLEHFELDFTLSVFDPETASGGELDDRDSLVREAGLSDSGSAAHFPILHELVKRGSSSKPERPNSLQPQDFRNERVEEAKKRFSSYDKQGSGTVAPEDVTQVFGELFPHLRGHMLDSFLREELQALGSSTAAAVDLDTFLSVHRRLYELCRSVVTGEAPSPTSAIAKKKEQIPAETSAQPAHQEESDRAELGQSHFQPPGTSKIPTRKFSPVSKPLERLNSPTANGQLSPTKFRPQDPTPAPSVHTANNALSQRRTTNGTTALGGSLSPVRIPNGAATAFTFPNKSTPPADIPGATTEKLTEKSVTQPQFLESKAGREMNKKPSGNGAATAQAMENDPFFDDELVSKDVPTAMSSITKETDNGIDTSAPKPAVSMKDEIPDPISAKPTLFTVKEPDFAIPEKLAAAKKTTSQPDSLPPSQAGNTASSIPGGGGFLSNLPPLSLGDNRKSLIESSVSPPQHRKSPKGDKKNKGKKSKKSKETGNKDSQGKDKSSTRPPLRSIDREMAFLGLGLPEEEEYKDDFQSSGGSEGSKGSPGPGSPRRTSTGGATGESSKVPALTTEQRLPQSLDKVRGVGDGSPSPADSPTPKSISIAEEVEEELDLSATALAEEGADDDPELPRDTPIQMSLDDPVVTDRTVSQQSHLGGVVDYLEDVQP